MRWGEKETCTFVNLYLEHEILWNPRLPGYKNQSERHTVYTKLIADFHDSTGICLSEPEVRTKIKNLRSTYVQEVNKIRKRSSPSAVFKPSIKWFSAWHKCFNKNMKKGLQGIEDTVFDQPTPPNEDTSQKVQWIEHEDVGNHNSNSDPYETEPDNFLFALKPEPCEDIKEEQPLSSYRMKKKKFKHHTNSEKSDESYQNNIDNDFSTKEDEFDIYGKFIASQLRKMNLQKALRLQLEIQSLLSQARISDISEH